MVENTETTIYLKLGAPASSKAKQARLTARQDRRNSAQLALAIAVRDPPSKANWAPNQDIRTQIAALLHQLSTPPGKLKYIVIIKDKEKNIAAMKAKQREMVQQREGHTSKES